jgi:hypothetical protein
MMRPRRTSGIDCKFGFAGHVPLLRPAAGASFAAGWPISQETSVG